KELEGSKKKAGNLEEAIKLYEKAIRADRAVLSEDDFGLIEALRKDYEVRFASSPLDLNLIEGMGFIYAVCFSNLKKALEFYKKLYSLSSDERIKARTQFLIDRLTVQLEMSHQIQSDALSKNREERLKEWNEMEKQERLAAQNEKANQQSERLSELYRSRDDFNARLPQIEDQVKYLEEELDRTDGLWHATNNRMYRRKRETAKDELDAKKKELEGSKKKVEEIENEINRISKAMEAEAAATQKMPNPDNPENTVPTSGEDNLGVSNPSNTPFVTPSNGPSQPDTSTSIGSEVPSTTNAVETPLPPVGGDQDPALPTESPDFPANSNSSQ
ncbi:hypothetical protein HYY75_04305, partial [bacterium]|nr:hypothetical protein [bacterium]